MGGAEHRPNLQPMGVLRHFCSGVLEPIPFEVGEGLEVRARIAGQRALRELDDAPSALGKTICRLM